MNINVRVDISRAVKKIGDVSQKQVPFATASALTATVKAAQKALTAELDRSFDKPTPFTKRAIGIESANKRTLRARVFIKRDQLKYLTFGIDGGTRLPKKKAIPLPVDVAVNQYGNLPRNKLAQLLSRNDVFSGVAHGVGGIWQRQRNGTLTLLVSWKPKAEYKKRYPFYELGSSTVKEAFPAEFRKAIAQAMRTAR